VNEFEQGTDDRRHHLQTLWNFHHREPSNPADGEAARAFETSEALTPDASPEAGSR
jgi:hypothetical protein